MTNKRRTRSVPLEAVGKLEKVPPAPKHLTGAALELWMPTCRYLLDRGTLHSSDIHLIEQFCFAISRARQLQRVLDEQGYCDASGKTHPALRLIEGVVTTIRSTSVLLGLAPYARQRMTAAVRDKEGSETEESEWARLLKR